MQFDSVIVGYYGYNGKYFVKLIGSHSGGSSLQDVKQCCRVNFTNGKHLRLNRTEAEILDTFGTIHRS